MATLGALKKKKAKNGKLAQIKAKKQQAKSQGPRLIGLPYPEPDTSNNPWAKKKQAARDRNAKESDKQDKTYSGLRIGKVREHDGYWTVDVVNGDDTYRFSNRHGSWMIPLEGGRNAEAKTDITISVHDRWLEEIRRQKRSRGYLLHGEHKAYPDEEKGKKKDKQVSKKKPAAKKETTKPKKGAKKWGPNKKK